MTPADRYLAIVRRKLAGMDANVRRDILRELQAHLSDATAEGGEPALQRMEPPDLLAARYKDLYGFGTPYQAIFVTIAAALAVPTLPILLYVSSGTIAFLASAGFLILLIAYLLAVAVRAGSRVGLYAGLAASIARFGSLAVFQVTADAIVADAAGWILFTLVSILLVAIGWLPGRAREKWRRRDVSI